MAEITTEEPGVEMPAEEALSRKQLCQSGEASVELRSSEQIENGTALTSPPHWDSDEDDGGPKPSDLYGKYTWKIDKFSQVNKRELRSNAFDIGGYKWYILIYPQGCDVCSHLSLFLCVSNHDKLLPGWSHFAQFTIAVVNKDPKKSKYSDALHRFWKKEHDWGWKKFMELSKMMDGFDDADTLIIKAQVQVIRERADRPFRCLDCQYRRELVRVYLTNVEQICRRFVEECRGKLGNLIEDKARWSSFRAFWLSMDQSSRRCMSREKTDSMLKVVVKHFFIEKEVTSTLVMDSLYSGLKALKSQSKGMKIMGKFLETEELQLPVIRIEKETIALVDDVLLLLERAAMEPLPPKDEKGPQNRTKDGAGGEEFSKDSIERDERRLTELGRRTIEIFVLAHIFSKIEVAYQEAVSLKRQEELIREEEAAWLADIEQKMKSGALEKEKKSKKKQGKQKRNNRKGKDKSKDDKVDTDAIEKTGKNDPAVDRKDSLNAEPETVNEKLNLVEDVSDASPDSEDREESPVSWDADITEVHPPLDANGSEIAGLSLVQNGVEGMSLSTVDDSSSTCSTESVLSVVTSVAHNASSRNHKFQNRLNSGKNRQRKLTPDPAHCVNEELPQPTERLPDERHLSDACRSAKTMQSISNMVDCPLQNGVNLAERNVGKEELHRNLGVKNMVKVELSGDRTAYVMSPPRSPSRSNPSIVPSKLELKIKAAISPAVIKRPSSESFKQADSATHPSKPAENAATFKCDAPKFATPKHAEDPSSQTPIVSEKLPAQHAQVATDKPSMSQTVMSRPLSAPIFPAPRPTVSMVSVVQTAPILARSVSATSRLGPEATASAALSYVPQSYRNAIVGGSQVTGNSLAYIQNHSASSVVNAAHSHSSSPAIPLFLPYTSDRIDTNPIGPSFSFGMSNHHEILQKRPLWVESSQMDNSSKFTGDHASLLSDMHHYDLCDPQHNRSQDNLLSKLPAGTSGRQNHVVDEFPHIDIINELLDDEKGIGMGSRSFNSWPHNLNRQFSFPGKHPVMSSGAGQSSGSCRFERTQSSYLDDRFQHVYGLFPRNHYDPSLDILPQNSPRSYVNGLIDGLTPNQWLTASHDVPHPSIRKAENDGYPYHIPDASHLTFGANGYTAFRPSN